MAQEFPKQADVVIVGGGIVGCSIAYHLTKIGITNVVVLERKQLTSGTTWHAAGLVGQLRASRNLTELAKYTTSLFEGLEKETGQATGFKQNGSISLALSDGRYEELLRGASMAKNFGLAVDVLPLGELKERIPHYNFEGVKGGVFLPKDGQVNPIDVTQALAAGARSRGAKVFENTKVTRILTKDGRATGVETTQGTITADKVVVASGMWSRELGRSVGVNIPLHACEHFYIVSEPIEKLPRNMPVVRVPDECTYYKEDAGKLMVGAFEPKAKPWGGGGIDDEHAFVTLPEDMDHFEPILTSAIARVPLLETAGIQLFFNGPESFTPDVRYYLGEAPELKDLFMATGFNSIGIQSSGGAGLVLADWIKNGHSPMDVNGMDIRRIHSFQSNKAYVRDRVTESLGLLYAMHWPYRQAETARGVRRSPFYQYTEKLGAVFGEVNGWERPNWYALPGMKKEYEYSYGRQNWFPAAQAEADALKNDVVFFDQSSFAKYEVAGRDACKVLNRISSNNVDVEPGKLVYTQWLNERGGIEADLTVTRLAEDRFLVVTGAVPQTRDMAWLKKHTPADAHCVAVDVTSGLPMLSIMGLKSRALLEKLSGADLSNAAFPFGTSQELEIGYARVRASRITYVGELGWELYIPAEFAAHVIETVLAAGAEFKLKPAGMHTMNNARMEKAYRHWGHDIADEDTPLEAGLGFACAWDKPGGFIGKDALLPHRGKGFPKRMVALALEDTSADAPMIYHEEPVYRDGVIVGSTTSGAFGHRMGLSLGLAYVKNEGGVTAEWINAGTWEVELAWKKYPAKVQLQSFYDPKSERIKA
ncbi:GcvT family protein [Aestuariivirga litoralis]|uniref:GcvT family protein n=1 Tax=Aestuariivirga litoralis TaxID=2650924 RepID=UPI0018C66EA3|nr:FAD-dependent oxidoreductase [Aestuariivirga litoralis]MBG1231596.1 FAD-dependent oxidoreductase [Aestuariivirga litoralis]